MEDWRHLLEGRLEDWTERVFGQGYHPEEAKAVSGGAQKLVYQIRCSNGFRFMLYVWDMRLNYFREELEQEEAPGPISGYGGKKFQTVNAYLRKLQVGTPELYHFEAGSRPEEADFAFVEYIDGKEASDFFQADPGIQDQVFGPLAEMLTRMHEQTCAEWGPLDEPPSRPATGCHWPMLTHACRQLEYLSAYRTEFRNHRQGFVHILKDYASKIVPRSSYSFIHAELGPNHVLVDERLRPWLIDIEGALFFDAEYEHSFMEFRFDNYGPYFKNGRLDPVRMAFYKLYHHISYSAGAHRLLQRGYPDAEAIKDILEYNSRRALRMLVEPAHE
ncbi:phosphotransferase [Paenibacillus sp. NFR01]|uniref:phosphotransferase n=1 Tax=Paenibacillus sp. NFR01 TaxID=1566279 RepID=UPI0008D34790|nr:phosphotransferase [Paenibacillus sp. NFR01]SET05938.1 Phosphotransferase enzyme family protein [Paenibacillus sp. NFR01]